MLERFAITIEPPSRALNRWVSAVIRLFRPQIVDLIRAHGKLRSAKAGVENGRGVEGDEVGLLHGIAEPVRAEHAEAGSQQLTAAPQRSAGRLRGSAVRSSGAISCGRRATPRSNARRSVVPSGRTAPTAASGRL